MSDKEINAISRVDRDGTNRMMQNAAQIQEMAKRQAAAQASDSSESVQSKQDSESRMVEQMSEAITNRALPMNTSLRFQIDDETSEVTVLIVDRATEEVLHTIPADAIKNIPAGKLMQYFA